MPMLHVLFRYMLPGPTRMYCPDAISIGSAVFTGLTGVPINIKMTHGTEWTLKYDEPEVENVARGRSASCFVV